MSINLKTVTIQDCEEMFEFKGKETVIRAGRILGFIPKGMEWDWAGSRTKENAEEK